VRRKKRRDSRKRRGKRKRKSLTKSCQDMTLKVEGNLPSSSEIKRPIIAKKMKFLRQ